MDCQVKRRILSWQLKRSTEPPVFSYLPEPPTDTFPTYRDRVANFTAIAEGMVTEGEVNPNQAELEWLNDPETQQEYQDYLDDIEAQRDRVAELETQENEAYEAHLEAQAEVHDLARLGESAMHAFAGHDLNLASGGQSLMTRQARGKRPAYFTCWDCGTAEEYRGHRGNLWRVVRLFL